MLAAAALAACSNEAFELGEGAFGGVAADEPRAAMVMRDVLASGGAAADAAVAGFFALAVTLPSSSGLSAAGACAVFDPSTKRFQQIRFPPRPSADSGSTVALPLAPRAMYALHARYGRQDIRGLIGKAEQLARFGAPVSTRLAADLRQYEQAGGAAPGFAATLGVAAASGGRSIARPALAETLGRLRRAGIGDLYAGESARAFAGAARAAGYRLDMDRLRGVLPDWSPAATFAHDQHRWSVVAVEPDVQTVAAGALSALLKGGWTADPVERARLLRDAAAAGAAPDRPDAAGATAFMAVDRTGQAVACAIGMGRPFGLGQVAASGIVLRAAAAGPASALAMLVGNDRTWLTHMGAVASGGAAAQSALLQTVLDRYRNAEPLDSALARPRIHAGADRRMLYVEAGGSDGPRPALERAGFVVETLPAAGAVSLFHCPEGIPQDGAQCALANDRRGSGLALYERD